MKHRKLLWILIKVSITSGLIYWLFSSIEVETVRKTLALIGPAQIGAVLGLHISAFLLGSLRWWLFLKHTSASTPYFSILPSYYLGLFFNNILPTGQGGDVIRTVRLNLQGLSAKGLISSAIIDRVIGLIVVLFLGISCILVSPDIDLDKNSKNYLLIIVLGATLGALFLLTPYFNSLIENLHSRYRHTKIRRTLLEIIKLCYSYRKEKRLIIIGIVLSVIMQSLVILTYYFLGNGIGIELSLITYFAIIPIVFLAASLPISIGGLGVREGVLVGLLISAKTDGQLAISLSLLYLIILWISSIPGAIVMLQTVRNKTKGKVL